jgi:hypothetical protein
MRNVWKGMIVGALTGAGVGAALDLAAAAKVHATAPEIRERAKGTIGAAVGAVRDRDIVEHAREAVGDRVDALRG